jgi:hypothetical protein
MEHGDLFLFERRSDEGGGRSVANVCRWVEERFMMTGRRAFMFDGKKKAIMSAAGRNEVKRK